MKKYNGWKSLLAGVLCLLMLAGCVPVHEESDEYAALCMAWGLGKEAATLKKIAAKPVKPKEEPEEPAPAPVQPITQRVTEDPIFKQTEEDVKEDAQKGAAKQADGDGGTIVIPDPAPKPKQDSEPKPETPPTPPPSESTPSTPDSSEESSASSAPESSASSLEESSAPSTPPENGWYEENGNTYCYVGGKKLTGWQNINNVPYWFNDQGVLSCKNGIDVSQWNGTIDWAKVKAAGIDFVFIRAGVRGYVSGKIVADTEFVKNIEGALANGLEVGVYFFSQAVNAEEGAAEAEWTLNAIQGYGVTGPIVIDTEYVSDPEDPPRGNQSSIEKRTDAVVAFCDTVRAAGYTPMIYASRSWYDNQLDTSRLTNVRKWLAVWSTTVSWSQSFEVWQATSTGRVDGISGDVDRNVWKVE